MHRRLASGLGLLLAFLMLWAPLGQYEFLYEHWMKVGVFMAPFLVFAALVFRPYSATALHRDAQMVALLLLCAYIAHQFEEHWVDLYGNTYAFQDSVNAMVRTITNAPPDQPGPLSVEAIYVINTSLVWLVGFIAIWRAPHNLFPTLAMAGIVLVNGVSHIALGAVFTAYNPGLLSSIVLFIPAAVFAYWTLRPRWSAVALSLAWAIAAHVIMVVGMLASTWWGLVPPIAYFAALGVWSAVVALVKVKKGEELMSISD